MSIYRGAGGASDATDDATVNAVAGYAADAATSATEAAVSASNAATSAAAANTSVTSATTQASLAAASASDAASQANLSIQYADSAAQASGQALARQTAAAISASSASTSVTNAATSATNAATSATSASGSAGTATTKATEAAASAASALAIYGNTTAMNTAVLNAQIYAVSAAGSATGAGAQATIATQARTDASNFAGNASNSASSAYASASTATSAVASIAAFSASANTAATNAGNSATAAASSASSASTSATNAANSATTATTQATNAATSAGTATTKAAEANTSAINAQTSEDSAESSANAAAISASNAAASAVTASTAASSTLAVFGSITAIDNAVSSSQAAATQAAASSVTATSQATIATTQATNASNSASQAAASAASATAIVTGEASTRPSIRPSLLLDFASTRVLDPRITFTRASTATFYDNDTSAVAEQNLLTQSQSLAVWAMVAVTTSDNATNAPDGTGTASLLTEDAATSAHYITRTFSGISGNNYAYSIFVKKGDGVGSRNFIQVGFTAALFGSNSFANFDINSGTVTSTGAGLVSASIVALSGGWYRCQVIDAAASTGTGTIYVAAITTGTSAFLESYAGDVTANTFLWGAQLEQRSAVTPYTPTTTAAVTNYIPVLLTAASGVARFDCDPVTRESLGLLIEESRTNLLTYSSEFDNAAWTKSNASITANTLVAPDGLLSADKLVENTATAIHQATRNDSQSFTSGVNYTLTCYVKAGERYRGLLILSSSGIAFGTAASASFDLQAGTITAGTGAPTVSITSVGNGWYRLSASKVATTTATETGAGIRLGNATGQTTYLGDGFSGFYIWGAQLEAGAFATSYIPTVASQVTRALDAASMTGTNFSSWYNIAQGTFYGEASSLSGAAFRSLLRAVDNSSAGNFFEIGLVSGTNNGVSRFQVTSNAASQWDTGNSSSPAFVANTFYKLAAASKVNNFAGSISGGAVVTDTVGSVAASLTTFEIGGRHLTSASSINGTIKRLSYYPVRLSNTELQGVTS
jgi:hypothetical protein